LFENLPLLQLWCVHSAKVGIDGEIDSRKLRGISDILKDSEG